MAAVSCPACDFVAKSERGLVMHQRARHQQPTNVSAIEQTIDALREDGQIKPRDAAKVQAVRALARAVDAEPTNGALWRQYQVALDQLMRGEDVVDDALTSALGAIAEASRAAMGNSKAS